MMDWIWRIVIGFIVGVVAKFLTPGRDPGGCVMTIIIGLIGSIIGGALGRALGFYGPGEPAGFIMSVIGAIILLFLYRLVIGKRPKP